MTALIIVGIFFLIIVGILFLPVHVDMSFKEDFDATVKFLGIRLYKTKPQPEEKEDKKPIEPQEEKKENTKKENEITSQLKGTFSRLKREKGFVGAVQEIMALALRVLSHIKKLLRHINICKVRLNITVASSDAARTAIDYGLVCQAVYPVTAMLGSVADVSFKEINVKSDFESEKCDFSFSATVKLQIFYLLIAVFKIFSEYKNFVTEKNENERKQS